MEQIYQGLFFQHLPIHDFLIMAAPVFIHLAQYFLFRLIFPFPQAFIMVTVFDLYLFAGLFLLLIRTLSADPIRYRLTEGTLLLGITLLAIPSFWAMGTLDQSLFYADHFLDVAIMNLLSLWLLSRVLFFETYQKYCAGLLFMTVVLVSLSDPSYLLMFVAPALFSLSVLRKWRPASLIATAALLGYLSLRHLPAFGFNVDYTYIQSHFNAIPTMLGQMARGFIFLAAYHSIVFLIWLASLCYLIKQIFYTKGMERFLTLFLLSMIPIGLLGILLFDPDITPITPPLTLDVWFFRHASAVIYLPIFFCTPLILQEYWSQTRIKQLARYFFILIIGIQALIFWAMPSSQPLKILFGPPEKEWPWLACVNRAKNQYHLQAGIGSYWVSRPFILYANLPTIQVHSNFKPYYWMVETPEFQRQHFDFIVADGFDLMPQNIIKQYGLPTTIVNCPIIPVRTLSLNLLIYPRGISFQH